MNTKQKSGNVGKKIFLLTSIITASVVLSGCSLTGRTNQESQSKENQGPKIVPNATFIRSVDAGTSWESKVRIDDKNSIAGNVLSIAVNPADPNVVYLGMEAGGLLATKDGGENWVAVPFADKVYGLAIDPRNPNLMYASGILAGRGKIYKRLGEDGQWNEIYTEPEDGTIISSFVIDPRNPDILFAGTSNGVIIKSKDAGKTWINVKTVDNFRAPVTSIAFDAANSNHMYILGFNRGLLETIDGGNTLNEITDSAAKNGDIRGAYSMISDPFVGGQIYVGTGNGIYRCNGANCNQLNIIESSKAFPVKAIAVNPRNSKEVIYSTAHAIYRSTDNGMTWSTFQLDTSKEISVFRYDPMNPARIYAGMRKY